MAGYDSVRVEFRGDVTRFDAAPDKLRRAIQLALNTVGRSTRTQSWREIRDEINLKPSYIQREVNFIPATPDDLRVIIYARSRGVTLSQFPHRQLWRQGKNGKRVPAGMRVDVGKGWTELNEGAFIAPLALRAVKFLGLNEVNSGKPRVIEIYRVNHSPASMSLIGDEFQGMEFTTKAEKDPTKQGTGLSQYMEIKDVA